MHSKPTSFTSLQPAQVVCFRMTRLSLRFEDRDDHRTACASVVREDVRLERNTNYFGCATTRK